MTARNNAVARIPIWLLFLPYIIVPSILCIIIANHFGNFGLQARIPQSPEQIFVLGIIFENPHIIASNIMLLDREYLAYYRRDLIIRLGLVATISLFVIVLLGDRVFYTLFYGWTIYHVARQQLGIGKMLNQATSRLYEIWSSLFIGGALAVAIGVGFFKTTSLPISSAKLSAAIILWTALVAIGGFILCFQINNPPGRLFLIANVSLLAVSTLAFLAGLPLLAILLPRIVHDTTAFIIYINHDMNRNTPVAKHFLYKTFHGVLPIWLTLVLLALIWGGLVTYSGINWMILIIIALTLAHYTTEGFTWKFGTLHRKYLHFQLSKYS